jgi:hypothetical protein
MLAVVPMSAPASCCTIDEVYLGQEPLVVQAQAPAPSKGQLELEAQVLAVAGKEAAATPDHPTTIAEDIPPALALATVVVSPLD